MKHFIAILFIALSINTLQGQRSLLTHPYHGGIMNDISFCNKTHGWKGGEKGTLYYTEDGGVSWSLKYHPEEITIKSIHMVDENTLWLVGNSGEVSYTRNRGITWTTQIYPEFINNGLARIYFFDSTHGMIITTGSSGFVKTLITTDSGNTWLESYIFNSSSYFSDATFIKSGLVWLANDDGIYHSTDYGNTWILVSNFGGAYSIHAIDDTKIWVAGLDNMIMYSDDGGYTFNLKNNGIPFSNLPITLPIYEISFWDNDNGILISPSWLPPYKTTDGGENWQLITNGANYFSYKIRKVQMLSKDESVMLPNYKTYDQFETLVSTINSNINIPATDFLTEYNVVSKDEYWVGTFTNQLLYKNNQSNSLSIINTNLYNGTGSPPRTSLFDVYNDSLIIILDETNNLYTSNDRANSWHNFNFNSNINIVSSLFGTKNSIKMIDTNIGYGVINSYFVKTTDSGKNWYSIDMANMTSISSFQFLDTSTIISHYDDSIRISNNGGDTWSPFAIPSYYSNLFFTSPTNGWVSTLQNIMHTTDGAQSWTVMPKPIFGIIESINFLDSLNGFMIGERESVKTSDGGITWSNFPIKSSTRVTMFTDSTGWYTEYGSLYMISPIDQTPPIVYTTEIALCNSNSVNYNGTNYSNIGVYNLTQNTDTIFKLLVLDKIKPLISEHNEILNTKQYTSYQWYLNGSQISGANGRTYMPSSSGWYQVEGYDINGCSGISDSIFFTMVNTNDIPLVHEPLKIYPNPSTGQLTIDCNLSIYDLEIFDMLGQLVFSVSNISNQEFEFNLSRLASGTYYVRCSNQEKISTSKLILNK